MPRRPLMWPPRHLCMKFVACNCLHPHLLSFSTVDAIHGHPMRRAIQKFASTGLACALLVAIAALASPVRAQTGLVELKLGILAHDVPDLWSGFQREETWGAINVEALFFPLIPLPIGSLRPAVGATISTAGDTSHAYVDARWQIEGPLGVFFAVGLGAAVHTGELDPVEFDRKALGSRVLFHVPVEVGIRLGPTDSLSVYYEHMSNGELAKYNEGMDNIGVRYGHKF